MRRHLTQQAASTALRNGWTRSSKLGKSRFHNPLLAHILEKAFSTVSTPASAAQPTLLVAMQRCRCQVQIAAPPTPAAKHCVKRRTTETAPRDASGSAKDIAKAVWPQYSRQGSPPKSLMRRRKAPASNNIIIKTLLIFTTIFGNDFTTSFRPPAFNIYSACFLFPFILPQTAGHWCIGALTGTSKIHRPAKDTPLAAHFSAPSPMLSATRMADIGHRIRNPQPRSSAWFC